MGYLFTFSDGKTLFYSGDLNVSASYIPGNQISSNGTMHKFRLHRSRIDYGILDAAFVGRRIGSANNREEQLLEYIEESIRLGHNHILFTPPSDYGLFLFLHLYAYLISIPTRKVDFRIFLDPQIISQLEILEWRIKRKQVGSLDDALRSFLVHRTTIAEGVRVFNYSVNLDKNLNELNRRNLRALLILDDQKVTDPKYLPDFTLAKMKLHGLDISRVGKAAAEQFSDGRIDASRIADFDGSIWLLHSSEQMLRDYLMAKKPDYRQIFLFHNFKGRITKFAKSLDEAGFDGKILHI
jgi:hypothetical protein